MSMLLKILAACVVAFSLAILAGVSGLSFYLWPTNVADQTLVISPQTIHVLTSLRAEPKFMPDQTMLYFGARSESVRQSAQRSVDGLLDSLILELPKNPKRSFVLAKFKEALESFSISESEERDQFLVYLQRIMTVVGVQNSGELLNVWRYGFPYGWFF